MGDKRNLNDATAGMQSLSHICICKVYYIVRVHTRVDNTFRVFTRHDRMM